MTHRRSNFDGQIALNAESNRRVEAKREPKMPEEHSNYSFSQKVTQQLTTDTRELWTPMADSFDREGPEAVKTYLDAERDRLEGNVRSLLKQFKEG